MQVEGRAKIVALDTCPPLTSGDGELVTGRFLSHDVSKTVKLTFSSGDTLEGTDVHPIWSPERQDWVPLGEFAVGDTMLSRDGTVIVEKIELQQHTKRVYNLEIHGEHVYEVTRSGILVHNALPGVGCAPSPATAAKPTWPATPQEMDNMLGMTGTRIPDTAATLGRGKVVWKPNGQTKITFEQHPYHPTAPNWHQGPHYHLDTPGATHLRFLPGDPIPGM